MWLVVVVVADHSEGSVLLLVLVVLSHECEVSLELEEPSSVLLVDVDHVDVLFRLHS